MQNQKLSSKMRITVSPQKLEEFSEKQAKFYTKYAAVACKTLGNSLFQGFLDWMMQRENIDNHIVTNVHVRMLPFRKENGNGLAGKLNRKGEIFIYPKRLEFCRRLMQDFEKVSVYFYIKARAMATLIHELLHIKYSRDENKVRQLTKKYFRIFTHHKSTQNVNANPILKMLFSP